jgi:hypothetical protein
MTDDYHTPLGVGGPLTAAYMEAPLGQLDEAIGDIRTDSRTIVIRASGGDDQPAIQAAIDAATPGTILDFPDEEYLLNSDVGGVCLSIQKVNVWFRGRGPDKQNNGSPSSSTTAFICGSSGATMVKYSPTVIDAPDATTETWGGGWENISLGGGGVAAVCLELQGGTNTLVFRNMWIGHATSQALLTGQGPTSATLNGAHSSYRHRFENVTFRQYTGAGTEMILLDGNPNALGGEHSYHIRFDDCVFIYSTGCTAIHVVAADDIYFVGCGWATSAPTDATTWSFVFDGSANQWADTVQMIGCYGANLPHMKVEGTGLTRPGRGHFAWPISMTDSSARPSWEVGGTLWYGDTHGRHNLRRDGRTSSEIQDDFVGGIAYAAGGTGGPSVGDLGWTVSLGAAGSLTALDAPTNHPGILRLATGAGATQALLGLRVDSSNRVVMLAGQTFFSYWVFRLTADHASMSCRIGFSNAPSSFPPSSGLYIEHLAADGANWYAVNRLGGSEVGTRTLLGALNVGTGAGNWVTLSINRRYDGAVGFSLGDQVSYSADVTHTANEPTGALTPIFAIVNSAAADSSLDIDYFQLAMHGLVR